MMMLFFTACGPENNSANTEGNAEPKTETKTEQAATDENKADKKSEKILVAFFSRAGDNYEVGVIEKGNTAIVAEMIAERTGADIFEIKPVKEYPAGYRECTEVAKQEQADNARPEMAAKVTNLKDYDTIFVGYPIWWSDFPMIINTFFEQHDFNGKTIIPFCTSAGDYMTGKESQIPEIAKGSTVLEGLGLKGKECQDNPASVQEKVNAWLTGLGH